MFHQHDDMDEENTRILERIGEKLGKEETCIIEYK